MNTKLPSKCARCGAEIMADKRCMSRTFCQKCKIEAKRESWANLKRKQRNQVGKLSDRKCPVCGNFLSYYNKGIFCDMSCYKEHLRKKRVAALEKWINTGTGGTYLYQPSKMVKEYMYGRYAGKCQLCGWGEINKYTGKSPLQVHHIDGDSSNNKLENLQLLCPNCHSLTENFGSRNRKAPKGKSKYFGSSKERKRKEAHLRSRGSMDDHLSPKEDAKA